MAEFDPAVYLGEEPAAPEKPEKDKDLPEIKARRQTYYYPETPENTRKAGLSYSMEGGIHGGPGFSDLDLREHTIEKFKEGKSPFVAVAMAGKPTGELFRTIVEGTPIIAKNVDTGGGLVPGQQDIATSNPDLARGGGTGGGGGFIPGISEVPGRKGEPLNLPELFPKEKFSDKKAGRTSAPSAPTPVPQIKVDIPRIDQPFATPEALPQPTQIAGQIPTSDFSGAVQEAVTSPPPESLVAAAGEFDPTAYLASQAAPTPSAAPAPSAQAGVAAATQAPAVVSAPTAAPVSGFDPAAYLGQPARTFSPSEVLPTPSGAPDKPSMIQKTARAVGKYAQEMVPRSGRDVAAMAGAPTSIGPEEIANLMLPMARPITTTVHHVLKRASQVQEADKTPAGSQERYDAGIAVALDMLQAGAGAKGAMAMSRSPRFGVGERRLPNISETGVKGSGAFIRTYRIDKELGDMMEGIGAARESGFLRSEIHLRNMLHELTKAQEAQFGQYLVSRRLKTVNPDHPQILPEDTMKSIESDPAIAKALDYYRDKVKPEIEGWRKRAGLTEEAAAGKEAEFISLIAKVDEPLPAAAPKPAAAWAQRTTPEAQVSEILSTTGVYHSPILDKFGPKVTRVENMTATGVETGIKFVIDRNGLADAVQKLEQAGFKVTNRGTVSLKRTGDKQGVALSVEAPSSQGTLPAKPPAAGAQGDLWYQGVSKEGKTQWVTRDPKIAADYAKRRGEGAKVNVYTAEQVGESAFADAEGNLMSPQEFAKTNWSTTIQTGGKPLPKPLRTISIEEASRPAAAGAQPKPTSPLARKQSRTTVFARPAEGFAKEYSTNIRDILDRSYTEVIKKARTRELFEAAKDKGIAGTSKVYTPEGWKEVVQTQDLPLDMQHDLYTATVTPPAPIGVGKAGRVIQRTITGAALTANPAELMNHMRRQLNIVAAKPPIGMGIVARLEALAPYFGPKLGAFKRVVMDDMNLPENQKILTDIFDAGGGSSRSFETLYESKVPGLKQLQHKTTKLLFGVPKGRGLNGWDLRMRVQLEKIRRNAEGNVDPQRIREFANQIGQYGSHPSWMVQGLRKVNPYAATTLPMRGTELKTAIGSSGLRGQGTEGIGKASLRQGETLLRGTGGTLLALATSNYLLSGKWPWENDKGHEFDLNTGVKNKDGKTVYVKLRAIAPELSRPVNTLGIPELLREREAKHPQYGAAAVVGPANQALSLISGPAQNFALTAATGKVPYFLKRPGEGPEMMDVAMLKKGEAAKGVSRLQRQLFAAIGSVNPAMKKVFGPHFEVDVPDGLGYMEEPIPGVKPFGEIFSTSYERKSKGGSAPVYIGR